MQRAALTFALDANPRSAVSGHLQANLDQRRARMGAGLPATTCFFKALLRAALQRGRTLMAGRIDSLTAVCEYGGARLAHAIWIREQRPDA